MGVPHQMEIKDVAVLELERWLETPEVGEQLQIRARIILMSADLHHPEKISQNLGIDRKSVYKWRRRFRQFGIEGLFDRSKNGHDKKEARRVRFALREACDELLIVDKQPTWEDLKRFCLLGLRETPDDDPLSQFACHGKLKVAWVQQLSEILKREDSGDDAETLLRSL